jgi:DNA-directed RNA polymerase subunit alpha
MRIRWREFELPNRVVVDEKTRTDRYALFTAEPFERGFGATVGNGLRRVLLSSLEGTAVTHVRIKGVEHEFSSLKGVVEDVTEIILNVKKLLVRSHRDEPRTLKVSRKGPGTVTAADLQGDADCEVVNTDLLLCTLEEGGSFDMELTVRKGRGYETSEEHAGEDLEIGVIPVDAIFSPVQRVRYKVQNTRVGKMTNFDKLLVEVWTDGTLSPELALVEAAKIYRKHLNPFVASFDEGRPVAAAGAAAEAAPAEDSDARAARERTDVAAKLSKPLAELGLSSRAMNALQKAALETVGDLCRRTEEELLGVEAIGRTTLKEVVAKLDELGLGLGMDVDAVLGRA